MTLMRGYLTFSVFDLWSFWRFICRRRLFWKLFFWQDHFSQNAIFALPSQYKIGTLQILKAKNEENLGYKKIDLPQTQSSLINKGWWWDRYFVMIQGVRKFAKKLRTFPPTVNPEQTSSKFLNRNLLCGHTDVLNPRVVKVNIRNVMQITILI